MNDCVFCNIDKSRIEIENDLALSFKDLYPDTEGHTMVIPKRRVQSFFELNSNEKKAMFELLESQKQDLQNKDKLITGFNIGILGFEIVTTKPHGPANLPFHRIIYLAEK